MTVPAPRTQRGEPTTRKSFSSEQKLRKPSEFKQVFRNPTASSDSCFKVLARKNSLRISRLGMAVSRNTDRRAVGRNRIKRVIRESFRHYYSENPANLDIVVLPRIKAASTSNERLFRSLEEHWLRLEKQFKG
jgi:ribonuclease P protein component